MTHAILVVTILALASPAHADELFYRLYPADAARLVDTHALPGVDLHLILDDASPARLMTAAMIVARADRVVVPGFRLMESKPAGGWLDRERWQRNADSLRALVKALGVQPGTRVGLDVEDYAGAMPMPSEAAFVMAALPFLVALRETGVVPCIYPAMGVDSVPFNAIVDAVDGRAELWTEVAFAYADDPMRGRAAIAVLEAAAIKRWPHAVIRHGTFDRALRSGLTSPAVLDDMRARGFGWAFDLDRKPGDKAVIGSPAWHAGTALASSNDVRHVWRFAPLSQGPAVARPSGLAFAFIDAAGSRKDQRSTLGTVLVGGQYLRAEALPAVGDFGAVVGVAIDAGFGPVMGACRSNAESWQVSLDGDALVLELAQGPGKKLSIPLLRSPPRNTPIRVAVSLTGKTWSAQAAGGARVEVTPPIAVLPGGSLLIGSGTAVLGRDPVTGKRAEIRHNGLVAIGAEVAHRGWSAAEMASVIAAHFPRVTK